MNRNCQIDAYILIVFVLHFHISLTLDSVLAFWWIRKWLWHNYSFFVQKASVMQMITDTLFSTNWTLCQWCNLNVKPVGSGLKVRLQTRLSLINWGAFELCTGIIHWDKILLRASAVYIDFKCVIRALQLFLRQGSWSLNRKTFMVFITAVLCGSACYFL